MRLIPKGDTLVTYYLLPLCGVNKTTFGKSFKTSYVNKEGTKVFVELKKNMVAPLYKEAVNYEAEIVIGTTKFVTFKLPLNMHESAQRFIEGKYSHMSSTAKKIIYKTSTLPYNKRAGSFAVSSPILQALDRTKTLRTFLLDYIGETDLPPNAEFIDKPRETWFVENRILD